MSSNTLRNNGLSITWLLLFVVFLGGQAVTGYGVYNEEQRQHGEQTVVFGQYLGRGTLARRCSRTGRASSCRWRCSSS